MNIREGASRIKFIGNTTLKFTSCGLVLALILALLEHYTPLGLTLHLPLMPVIILLFLASILAMLFLLAGWIIEGFAQPSNDRSR
jgi:uncharacterized membrane protein YvlD (DUF360 family)